LKVLESPEQNDKMWALNHINGYVRLDSVLQNRLIRLIDNENYSMAERAISAISSDALQSENLQLLLLKKFYEVNYSLKKLILSKITEATAVTAPVKLSLADNLGDFNGEILTDVLGLYKVHGVEEVKTYIKIAGLLETATYYSSKKVYDLLLEVEQTDKEVQKMLNNWASEQGIQ